MSVKTAYIAKLGKGYKISDHFTLGEMRCKDGSDKVLYSTELLQKLEELRAYGGFTVTINSGYRTAAYNKKIGGASASQHIKGTAADIVVKKDGVIVDAKKICCLCQTLGFKGIGYISANAAHVDMRASGSYRGDERSGYGNNVTDFYKYFGLNTSQITALKAATEINMEEEDMTQEQFNKMMATYLAQQAKLPPGDWSAKAREFVEDNKIFNGDSAGLRYKSPCTREEMAQILYSMAEASGDRALVDAIKSIAVPLEAIANK